MSHGHDPDHRVPVRSLTDAQVVAIAHFEAQFGEASHVPPGPRRTRFIAEAYAVEDYRVVAVVQTDRSYATPKVLVVWPDGSSVRADMEAWL